MEGQVLRGIRGIFVGVNCLGCCFKLHLLSHVLPSATMECSYYGLPFAKKNAKMSQGLKGRLTRHQIVAVRTCRSHCIIADSLKIRLQSSSSQIMTCVRVAVMQ
jgi:hypothetical protein